FRFGQLASIFLREHRLEACHPAYCAGMRWSGGFQTFDLPLFPGYLFCRFSPEGHSMPVITARGVIKIVSFGRMPLPIGDSQKESVEAVSPSELYDRLW